MNFIKNNNFLLMSLFSLFLFINADKEFIVKKEDSSKKIDSKISFSRLKEQCCVLASEVLKKVCWWRKGVCHKVDSLESNLFDSICNFIEGGKDNPFSRLPKEKLLILRSKLEELYDLLDQEQSLALKIEDIIREIKQTC